MTARPHIIIVIYIDIQHKLPLTRCVNHSLFGYLLHDSADIDFDGEFVEEHPLHLGAVPEGDVPFVDFFAVDVHCEVELAVAQQAVGVAVGVGQPGADQVRWEEVFVVGVQEVVALHFIVGFGAKEFIILGGTR